MRKIVATVLTLVLLAPPAWAKLAEVKDIPPPTTVDPYYFSTPPIVIPMHNMGSRPVVRFQLYEPPPLSLMNTFSFGDPLKPGASTDLNFITSPLTLCHVQVHYFFEEDPLAPSSPISDLNICRLGAELNLH